MIRTMFGYRIINGLPVIDENQAVVLRQIADRYVGGASLKSEAERLTTMRTEYAPGKWDWNKNRIQRLLTNPIYLGDVYYEPIIDGKTFERIQEIMQSRNTQKDCDRQTVFSSAVVPILCGKCGQPIIRKYNTRLKIPTHYICTGSDCESVYAIPDSALWSKVKELLLKADEVEQKPDKDVQMALYRLNNEIEHDLQGIDIEGGALKEKIFEYAALQYKTLNSHQTESMDFHDMNPCSPIFIQEIRRRVSAVLLDEENIRIRLTDGQTVGKENISDGSDNNENRTDEKDGHSHSADSYPAE